MLESELTLEEGVFLINLARKAIGDFLDSGGKLGTPSNTPEALKEKSGVFVTLNKKNGSKELRGCIGYPYPTAPLVTAIINSAIEAATGDPRFPSVSLDELNEIIIEVSVLTQPELIKVDSPVNYPKNISIGKDGLIMERGLNKGLLLPQVPLDWKWNAEEFLAQCCIKAGLSPDSWVLDGTKIFKFQAIIFAEEIPNGAVHLKNIL